MIKFKVFKCIGGEHKGKDLVFYTHGGVGSGVYQEVVNGKINRFPYMDIKKEYVENTEIELPYSYNKQVRLQLGNSGCENISEQVKDEMLVIAYRIVRHKERLDQFTIRATSNYNYIDSKKEYKLEVLNTSNKLFNTMLADITCHEGEYYVIHKDLHYDTRKRGIPAISDKMRESFDHKWLGMKYQKSIDLNELNGELGFSIYSK